MIIGIPKELKNGENRISVIPAGVKSLVKFGHQVLIEKGAGLGSHITDDEYMSVGAEIVISNKEIYQRAEMILKVKEPIPDEYPLLQENQILFAYLHLAPVPELTQALLTKKVIGIAYETIQTEDGTLPLLTPMSEIAGRMSIQVGAYMLQKENGGNGVLLGGVPGVEPGRIAIIGGGVVGANAAKMAIGTGAIVTILDINLNRLRYFDDIFAGRVTILMSDTHTIERSILEADLVIGGVLIPGARAPKLVTKEMVSKMKKRSVIVDVAVDQGGCVETTTPTTHENPTYLVDGVVHYCVANMPAAVPRTSTFALTNATLPFALKIANLGYQGAMKSDKALRKGLNVFKGEIVCKPVAEAMGLECSPFEF
jgi:alanine dehydrogenase